ncbi:MAG: PH domain-containing protein [Oscillospiraceae bacterium]|nr:PH domain-containing protein [Oscillospiraceae bacterium]
MKFDFYHWVKDTYMDIIVILIIFGSAWLRWFFVQFEIQEKAIYVRKGVLLQSEYALPYSVISCAAYYRPFLLRPFKAVKIILDSDSYRRSEAGKKADVVLIVSEIYYSQIYKNIPNGFEAAEMNFRASKKELLLFSMLFSSTLPGIIYLGTFFVQGSRIVGEKIEMRIFSAVNDVTEVLRIFDEGVTPLAVALLMIISGGWLLSFIINLLRHLCFEIRWHGSNITIENGFFSRWKYYVNSSKINYVDLRQNLLMKAVEVMSVHVSCTGYGKGKNELPVFVPVTTRRRVMNVIKSMLPDFTPSNILLKTKKSYVMVYVRLPLILVFGTAIAAAELEKNFPEWGSAVKFLGMMLEIPLVYLLAVKIAAKISTGIGVSRTALTIRYCKAYRFHTVIVPKGRIAYIKIRRTLFQRVSGCCDVVIYTRGESVRAHRVRGIMFADVDKLVNDCDKMC